MFSKAVLLGALAGSVAANPIQRAVVEAVANAAAPQVVFSPSAPVKTVVPGDDLASDPADNLSLLQEDNFYWAHADEGKFSNSALTYTALTKSWQSSSPT